MTQGVSHRRPLLRSIQNSSIRTYFNTYFQRRVSLSPPGPKVRIRSWKLTHSVEPFYNVSNAPVLYALAHLRQHHRPSVTVYGSKGVDAILSTLHVILQGEGGGNADTGPGFKARTRISHSCLGHPARHPVPVGCRDWWRCTSKGSSPLRTLAISWRRVTMCLGVLQSGQCLHHVPAIGVYCRPGTLPTAQHCPGHLTPKDFAFSDRWCTATNYPPSKSTTLYRLGTSRVYSSSLLNFSVIQNLQLLSCVNLYNITITGNDQRFLPWKKRSTLPTNEMQSLFRIICAYFDEKQYAADKIFGINHTAIDKEHHKELGDPTYLQHTFRHTIIITHFWLISVKNWLYNRRLCTVYTLLLSNSDSNLRIVAMFTNATSYRHIMWRYPYDLSVTYITRNFSS